MEMGVGRAAYAVFGVVEPTTVVLIVCERIVNIWKRIDV